MNDRDDYESTVAAMGELMVAKLRKNGHKGDAWEKDSPEELLRRLVEETLELSDAVDVLRVRQGIHGMPHYTGHEAQRQKILDEAVDVANFAMFIIDNQQRILTSLTEEQ